MLRLPEAVSHARITVPPRGTASTLRTAGDMASTPRAGGDMASTPHTAMGFGAEARRGTTSRGEPLSGRESCAGAPLLSSHDSKGTDFGVGIDARVAPRPFPPRLRASAPKSLPRRCVRVPPRRSGLAPATWHRRHVPPQFHAEARRRRGLLSGSRCARRRTAPLQPRSRKKGLDSASRRASRRGPGWPAPRLGRVLRASARNPLRSDASVRGCVRARMRPREDASARGGPHEDGSASDHGAALTHSSAGSASPP
jgi:hypothetical protein